MAKIGWIFPRFIAIFSIAALIYSCGPYSFNPSGMGAKTIAVPLFENQTTQFGIREALTDSVTARFLRDNSLKVSPSGSAELLLSGSIVRYERTAHTFDANQQVKQYVVNIWANVLVANQRDKKTVWEQKELLGFGIYDANLETDEVGKARAISKLAEDIVNRTVRGW